MKNLIAELLIKLAEKDEEYKLQTDRLVAIEAVLSALLDSLSPETRVIFEQKLRSQIESNIGQVPEEHPANTFTWYQERFVSIKTPLSDG